MSDQKEADNSQRELVPNSSANQLESKEEQRWPSSKAFELLDPNWTQLTIYILAMSIGSLQVGWAILGNTQTALILIEQFGWAEEDIKLYNSILGNCGLIGVCIGSLFGGPLIVGGRRRAILIFSCVLCFGVALTLIQTMPTMCIGRFITGFSGGILQMCNIKAVQETFPSHLVGLYGSSSGAFLAIGVFLVAFIGGVSLPDNEEDYAADKMWRLSYAFPLVWVIW
jgi:MFS family permease